MLFTEGKSKLKKKWFKLSIKKQKKFYKAKSPISRAKRANKNGKIFVAQITKDKFLHIPQINKRKNSAGPRSPGSGRRHRLEAPARQHSFSKVPRTRLPSLQPSRCPRGRSALPTGAAEEPKRRSVRLSAKLVL